MEEIDVWRAAQKMIDLYGEDASIHAAMRADKAMDMADTFNFGCCPKSRFPLVRLGHSGPIGTLHPLALRRPVPEDTLRVMARARSGIARDLRPHTRGRARFQS